MKPPCSIPVTIGLLALLGAGCQREAKTEEAPAPQIVGETISFPTNSPQLGAIEVATAESRLPAGIQLFGRLIWNDNVTVRVFTPFGGRVRKILAPVGQAVEKNAPLTEVESPDFGQAQADVRAAESSLQLAQRNLARLRELLAHGAAAQKDVEAAENDEARATTERARAAARLEVYGASAESVNEVFTLRSPITGIVVEKNLNPGQEIRADQMLANAPELFAPLFVVSDPARLWIQIDATESDLPHLQPGRQFSFTSRASPDETFTGKVDTISEFIDPTTRTIKVRGSVDNSRRLLKAEMFVSVNLPSEAASAVSVPAKAVFLNGEKHFVFVEEQERQFARREVGIGEEQGGLVRVLSGLEPGQRVVTSGCLLLQEMME